MPTGMPARYPTSSRTCAPFSTASMSRSPSGMQRHSTGMRYPTGHNRLPTGVGWNGPVSSAIAAESGALVDPITRPTIRLDSISEAELIELSLPRSNARWPWALGVGAILAFGSAYLLTQHDEPRPRTAHLATAAPAPVLRPSAANPEPPAPAWVEPEATSVPARVEAIAETPTAVDAPVASKPAEPPAQKVRSRSPSHSAVQRKADASKQPDDEIDVGF
jgi:hypothetical protein